MKQKHILYTFSAICFTVAISLVLERNQIREYMYERKQAMLPAESSGPTITPTIKIPTAVRTELNIAVPFTPQAPFAAWDDVHEETCEETSELMVDAYFNKKSVAPEVVDAALSALNEWENTNIGEYMNTNADQAKNVLKNYFNFSNVTVKKIQNKEDFLQTVKTSLNNDQLIIMPAAGRLLGNPNFTPPGPMYHMLVIKGYTKDDEIITNDPGTRLGHNYVYKLETIYNALHDWNNGDTEHGEKTLIIVGE